MWYIPLGVLALLAFALTRQRPPALGPAMTNLTNRSTILSTPDFQSGTVLPKGETVVTVGPVITRAAGQGVEAGNFILVSVPRLSNRTGFVNTTHLSAV